MRLQTRCKAYLTNVQYIKADRYKHIPHTYIFVQTHTNLYRSCTVHMQPLHCKYPTILTWLVRPHNMTNSVNVSRETRVYRMFCSCIKKNSPIFASDPLEVHSLTSALVKVHRVSTCGPLVAHRWSTDGPLVVQWWSTDGSVVVHWWFSGGLVLGLLVVHWRSTVHWCPTDVRLVVRWWSTDGPLVFQWWSCGSSLMIHS